MGRRSRSPALHHHRGGSGPPLVLLHGLGLDRHAWDPLLPELEAARDVLALDLPGFGRSAPLEDGVAPRTAVLADAVERALDEAGLERPEIAGNSLGARLALELARRGRAASVVAIAPLGLSTPPERAAVVALNELMRARARIISRPAGLLTRPAPGRLALLSNLRARPWRVDPARAAEEIRHFARSPGFRSTLLATMGDEPAEGLSQIECPVRIAWGMADLVLPVWQAPRFLAAIPHACLRLIPVAGHLPVDDQPGAVAAAILDPVSVRERFSPPVLPGS
jgi:pimeloyl-ACP methyl ester carboxylesterase